MSPDDSTEIFSFHLCWLPLLPKIIPDSLNHLSCIAFLALSLVWALWSPGRACSALQGPRRCYHCVLDCAGSQHHLPFTENLTAGLLLGKIHKNIFVDKFATDFHHKSMTSNLKSNLNVLPSYEAFVLGHGPSAVASWLWPQIWLSGLLTSSLQYSDTSGPQLSWRWSVLLKSETCKNVLLNCHRRSSLVNWKMKKKELLQGSDSALHYDSVKLLESQGCQAGVARCWNWSLALHVETQALHFPVALWFYHVNAEQGERAQISFPVVINKSDSS